MYLLVAVSRVLEKYEEEFFEVMDAKYNLHRLKRKMVIDGGLMAKIDNTNDETAKELLFEHLKFHANVVSLREYCKMVIAAKAFPKMQKLGMEMLNELLPEGLFHQCIFIHVVSCPPPNSVSLVVLCVHVCDYACPLAALIKRSSEDELPFSNCI